MPQVKTKDNRCKNNVKNAIYQKYVTYKNIAIYRKVDFWRYDTIYWYQKQYRYRNFRYIESSL